jgi:hypothetical protein
VKTDVGADNTIAIIQCGGTDTAGTGLALAGGAKSNEASDNNPFFELSTPAEADGSEAEAGDQATGWRARVDSTGAQPFTVYALCASS